MPRTWLVFDCDYLCHRAFFSTGGLSHGIEPTGVVFGFLRDLRTFAWELGSTDLVFAFDSGNGLREGTYPFYKAGRRHRKLDDAAETARDGMRTQISALKQRYLPELGYNNVFFSKGYEADDVIASVVRNLPADDRAIMISADRDLYQLLSRSAAQYIPAKRHLYTARQFRAEYGIAPSQWPEVKAIAGCTSDEIPGIPGVGEKTAIDYLLGKPLRGSKRGAIDDYRAGVEYRGNLELVTLPYPNCPAFRPEPDDKPDPNAWLRLCERLGMRTLADAIDGNQNRQPVRRFQASDGKKS
jgi:DNA polymerase-1